ncbi:MAG: PAS domain-containing protein, partial [Betaproteobacteria bacterium]|nr:PAS domain-containing protein [Betaproteobacteria bacterium]
MSSGNEDSLVAKPADRASSGKHTAADRYSEVDQYARIMLNAAPVICTLWDIHGNLLDYNQEASDIFGLTAKSKSEYIEQFCDRPPEYQPNGKSSRSEIRRIIREVLETGYQRYEWMACTEGGEPLPLETSAVLIPWKGINRIVCYSRDLRKIRCLEQQTHEAEERSRLLLDSMPLGTSLWDQEGNILDCNQENLRMHNLSKADFFSKFFDVTCPKFQPDGTVSKDKAVANVRKAFESGYLKYEWTSCTASGETFPTEKTLVRVPWKGGWCIAAYTYDLRERGARLEAEEIARVLLDTAPMGTTLWDSELRLLDCNQETMRMFGLSCGAEKTEFIRNFFDLNPQFQSDGTPSENKAMSHLRKAFETGYERFEWMHQTTSGESIPAEITMIRIPWKDNWRVATYARDLREAKVHEREMRETLEYVHSMEVVSRAAQIASQAKSEFLAKMSHELRTPLNAAIGFLGLELQKKLPQESVDNLEISLDACHTLLHLINDILDISKIEAGHFELMNQDYHLVDL